MENVKVWAASVCVFCVVMLFYKMLFPSGNLKKTGETVMALLLLFVMLRPFGDLRVDAGALSGIDALDAAFDADETPSYAEPLKTAVAEALAGIDVYPSDISVQADLDAEQYLVLSGVRLTVSTEKTDEEIKACLSESLEIPETLVTIVR